MKWSKADRTALKQARRARKNKKCPIITRLERELGDLSAEEAATILINEFNFGQAQVEFLSGRKTTVNNILAIVAGHTVSASLVGPLYFLGGPRSQEARLFKGSLLTMVMDKILYENSINGSFADLVQR